MKTLRLFIDNDLENNVNWQLYELSNELITGNSPFPELTTFECDNLEVYLSPNCCSIFNLNVDNISDKRLTEELVLGMLEEKLVDDIEDVRPILIRLADGATYVAIFNRDFYLKLTDNLQLIGKPIKFIQSLAFCVDYQENFWTLHLLNGQSFVRTSIYEYYLLDDKSPIPQLLEDMLSKNPPNGLIIYAKNATELSNIINTDYNIECINSEQYIWGESIWNFYNSKTKKFQIKIHEQIKLKFKQSIKYLGYFGAIILGFWLINIATIYFYQLKLKHDIGNSLKGIVTTNDIKNSTIISANAKINELRHQKGFYNSKDMVALFSEFLKIVPDADSKILGINYSNGQLDVLLNNQFDTHEFASNKNIFATKGINAQLNDYKTYKDIHHKQTNEDQLIANDDVTWVITIQ